MHAGDTSSSVLAAPVAVCWSVKGGSGTTVVAAALALLSAQRRPTLLVDLAGDCAVALGAGEPHGPGVTEWLRSANADATALGRLAVPVGERLDLIPRGALDVTDADRWDDLAAALPVLGPAVVDAGTGEPPAALLGPGVTSLLVIRPCFLALRRASRLARRPSGVVLVREAGRALRSRDVEQTLGVGVVAEVDVDPAVARAVDAGLLQARLPRPLASQLRGAA
ncbi:MAG: cellulose synthase operon protein YhjQ/BcsQ [Ilumatobacteraceae bacterium]